MAGYNLSWVTPPGDGFMPRKTQSNRLEMARWLRRAATGWVLLFGLELLVAIIGEFWPLNAIGRALYPIYVGLDPWTPGNLFVNLSLLAMALGSFFFADKLEREAADEEACLARRGEGAVRFSQ
jgi:hypothetical protein